MKNRKTFTVFIPGLLMLLIVPALLYGQELTGNLKGVVTDPDGLALPGVTVTIESPQLLGGPKVAYTDENGKYRFLALAPGIYGMTVEMDGFQIQERKQQVIHVGKATSIDFSLQLETMAEQMIVTGETPVVDREETGVAHNVSQQILEDIPMGRSYQSVIGLLPGVKSTTSGGNPSVHGGSQRNNQYLIDGVDTTDPVTGTFGTNFTFDAVQDIQYATAGYLPEYGQVLGAVTNIVTKSGGNKLSGSAIFNTFQPSMRAEHSDPIKQEVVTQRTDYELSTTIGGPVKKDKIWYYGVFTYKDINDEKEALDFNHAWTIYYWLGKLTSQVGQNGRFTFQAFGDPYYEKNENFTLAWNEQSNPEREQGGSKFSGHYTWALSPNAFLEMKAYYNQSLLNIDSKNGAIPGIYDQDAHIRSVNTNEPYYLE
ncbi:carboxypeptidase regulatory-like domain-containing protein, partial [Acidobacteriota bacterium]